MQVRGASRRPGGGRRGGVARDVASAANGVRGILKEFRWIFIALILAAAVVGGVKVNNDAPLFVDGDYSSIRIESPERASREVNK
ncbi:hypothetical protein GCM10010232_38800 [Streptomyces amakusaensis]|uniref:Uncharacterized protein n=1 Tax=Streptomyces amakusaensis TaxID=67271 RepID=A0ABW0ALC9_9ACTN